MELIKSVESKVEFYTVLATGESGMSQSGLAILAGVDRSTLIRLENTLVRESPSETLEPFVGKALTLVRDPNDDFTIGGRFVGNLKIYKSSYCAAVIRHYALLPEDPKPAAIHSMSRFMEMGIETWIQGITGWQECDVTPLQTSVYTKRIEHMRDHAIGYDVWVIFRECAEILLLIEKDWKVPINDYDLLDGSIGIRWADYRKDKYWAVEVYSYLHRYRDKRGERPCNAFSYQELPFFRQWLDGQYRPNHLPKYLIDKYGKQAVRQIYYENGLINDEILELTEVKRKTKGEEDKYKRFLVARSRLSRLKKGE